MLQVVDRSSYAEVVRFSPYKVIIVVRVIESQLVKIDLIGSSIEVDLLATKSRARGRKVFLERTFRKSIKGVVRFIYSFELASTSLSPKS